MLLQQVVYECLCNRMAVRNRRAVRKIRLNRTVRRASLPMVIERVAAVTAWLTIRAPNMQYLPACLLLVYITIF